MTHSKTPVEDTLLTEAKQAIEPLKKFDNIDLLNERLPEKWHMATLISRLVERCEAVTEERDGYKRVIDALSSEAPEMTTYVVSKTDKSTRTLEEIIANEKRVTEERDALKEALKYGFPILKEFYSMELAEPEVMNKFEQALSGKGEKQ